MKTTMAAAVMAALLLGGGAAKAAQLHFTAALDGANELPANDSTGHGELEAELNTATHVLTYRATYSGLSGAAVAAHFHGPAAPGVNAPVVVPVVSPASPISGRATLTTAQAADLEAGKWYFNIHTKDHPGGEIRGQVTELTNSTTGQ
jgi:hypothetical protein